MALGQAAIRKSGLGHLALPHQQLPIFGETCKNRPKSYLTYDATQLN